MEWQFIAMLKAVGYWDNEAPALVDASFFTTCMAPGNVLLVSDGQGFRIIASTSSFWRPAPPFIVGSA